VVGIDGSNESARALDWAITQAQQSGAILDIVTAWMFPMAIGYAFTTTVEEVRKRAQDLLEGAMSHVADVAPDVVVRAEPKEQPAGPALVAASKGADLLVVGSRGMGGFEELLVGSVGHYCTRRARCSVVIVR
jgi:nucleotide-binding universal stress UspA family protein